MQVLQLVQLAISSLGVLTNLFLIYNASKKENGGDKGGEKVDA